ncbi:MAG: hypothetical protein DRI71_01635 [Bacteroidetes bacterium]|nr:MAG: hypothetical protein DRI71_01635 [Bacteroidota bacterium]
MKITYTIAAILFTVLTISCGGSNENDKSEANTETEVDEHPSDHDEATTEIKLSLNDGAKWNSDESTFTGMKRLELTLYNFGEDTSDPTLADYNKLGEALANIDKDIISQCSMKGKDHDQLHILLGPMLGNVDVIKNGEDIDAAKENIEALSQSIAKFFAHFEVK